MSVSATGSVDFANMIVQRSQTLRGQALVQLFDAFGAAVRAEAKPLANISDVKKIDITA
jgi:hypothetical protein